MVYSLERALAALVAKMTGKAPVSGKLEDILSFAADNYSGGGAGTVGPQGPAGPAGKDGVGISSITGTIDGSNKLTLTFTMSDMSSHTVEGTITPSA